MAISRVAMGDEFTSVLLHLCICLIIIIIIIINTWQREGQVSSDVELSIYLQQPPRDTPVLSSEKRYMREVALDDYADGGE